MKAKKAKENELARAYFPFFNSFVEALDSLDDDKTELSLYRAITHYGLYGKEPELTGVENALWALLKPILEKSRKSFENGVMGGAPKGNKNNRYCSDDHNQSTTEVQPDHNQSTTEVQTDKDKDKDKDKKENLSPLREKEKKAAGAATRSRAFVCPSEEEVKAYFQEKSLNGDPMGFYDHFTANGWMVGKSKMKDWKAAARNWSRREGDFSRPKAPKASTAASGKYCNDEWA